MGRETERNEEKERGRKRAKRISAARYARTLISPRRVRRNRRADNLPRSFVSREKAREKRNRPRLIVTPGCVSRNVSVT